MITIEKFSHFIRVTNPPYTAVSDLQKLSTFNTVKGLNQKRDSNKVFSSVSQDNNTYRFHINQLPHLISLLYKSGHTRQQLNIITHPTIESPQPLDASIQDIWTPRADQQPAIDYLTANDSQSKLLTLKTGYGKTFIALYALSILNKRTVINILPQYIEKWHSDITKTYNIDKRDILVVQGSSHLKGLIDLALNGNLTAKFIIISSRTLQNYITAYEEDPYTTVEEYAIPPDLLYPTLQAGVLLVDETHQHIHALFKALLYTHIELMIGLTATLISDNYIISRVHNTMYPPITRFKNPDFEKYTNVYAVSYPTSSTPSHKLRITEYGSNVYSHNAYEKYILSRSDLLRFYTNIIAYTVKLSYITPYLPGDKLAIYASTIALCDHLTRYFKAAYPHLDVRRYCEDDPYENVIDPDIRITTIISSGTAIDIPNLRVAILTTSIASPASNIQTLGRLRKLPDRDVKFIYLYNESIPKQVEYHRRKKELFYTHVATIKDLKLPLSL